jgi:hypothetical protein
MNWKAWLAFFCIQATGAWCVYSSIGHRDIKLLIGWWLLLFPGTFAALAVPLSWGIHATVAVAVSANAVAWFSTFRAVRFLYRRLQPHHD